MELNVKSFAGLVITTIIMVLLTVTILIPVVDSSAQNTQSFENPGLYYMELADLPEGEQITYSRADGSDIVTINGTDVTLPAASNNTLVGTENWVIRTNGRYYGEYFSNSTKAFELTLSNSTLTGTIGTTPINWNLGDNAVFATVSDTGFAYGPLSDSYVVDGSHIILSGNSTVFTDNVLVYGEFNIGEDPILSVRSSGNAAYTVTETQVNMTPVAGYNDLYTLQSVQFKINDGTSTSDWITYNRMVLPTTVVAHPTAAVTDSEKTLIEFIPILVLAGLVIGVVGSFIRNRD